jgi:phage tail sheath protein FI
MDLSPARLSLGKVTGLPLVMCPWCRSARVIELIAKTDLNYGHVFFKYPSNIELVS